MGFYGSAVAALYLVGVIAVFAFLRTVGFPVNIVHVALPPLWHRITEVRGWFFLDQSNRAFAEGRTSEGLLYLANAYEFDPRNYVAGITLAKNFQAGQPTRSDRVFEQLMRDHPDKRGATAQDWFRALLARGSFEKIAALARDQLLDAPAHGGVWLRALLFATARTGNDAPLREVRASTSPLAVPWHPVIDTELLLRSGRVAPAREALERDWPAISPPFAVYYRVNALIELHEPLAALDLLEKFRSQLDDQAVATLRLAALTEIGSTQALQQQIDALLAPRLNAPTVTLLCAHLIRRPSGAAFEKLWRKFGREPLTLDTENAGAWFSLLCAAGAVGDRERLQELTARLKQASNTPFLALGVVEAFFRGETAERRIDTFLPILPLPLEVTYALRERYSGPPVPRRA